MLTIVMQDTKIDMFHSSGTHETFVGPQGVRDFMSRFKKVAKGMETIEAINKAMTKGEMDKELRKLKASLKPLAKKPKN